MPTLTDDQVRALGAGMRSGRWANDEKAYAQARDLLKNHRKETFAESRIDATPDPEFIAEREALGPSSTLPGASGFASEEDEQEFLQGAEGQYRRMAEMGIDVRTGLDPEVRVRAGLLNFRPEVAGLVMEELINMTGDYADVPPEVPRFAQVEGNPVYLRKLENGQYKYTAADPLGVDSGDFAEFAGELPSVALETAGGVGGALAGGAVGNVPGAIAGSAAGSAALGVLALDARVKLAEWAGVPEELIDDAVRSEDRLWAAVLAAGGDLATAGVVGTIRAARNFKGGRIIEAEQLDGLLRETEKSLKQVAEFKDRTGQDLDLSMGQLTGDTDIMAAEQILKQRARGKTAKELGVRQINTDRAANDALRSLSDQQAARTPVESVRGTAEVAEDVQRGLRGEAEQAERMADLAEEELDAFTRSMDEAISPDTLIRVRDDAFEAAEKAAVAERQAWDNYRKEVEWKQGEGSNVRIHSGANSPIKKVLLDMDDDAGRALLESTRRSQQSFIKDAGLPDEGPTTGLAGEFLDPRELHFAVSDLKRRVRQAERGLDPDGFRVTDMSRMIGAIEETIQTQPMMRVSSGRTVRAEKAARIREAWDQANRTTMATHSLFDSANMRALLEINPRTGNLSMPSGMIYKRVFQEGDARFLDDALEAVGYNPRIKADLAEELLKKHKNATKADFSGNAHRKFMDDHYDHIRVLGLDPDKLRGAGGLARAVKEAQEHAAKVQKRLAQTFGRRLTDDTADATNVHTELLGVGKRKAENVMNFLDRQSPELANQVRVQSLNQIKRDLSSNGDTSINFDGLWKAVDEKGDQLAAMHGRQYVEDLRLLKRTQRLINREKLGRSIPGQTVQPAWLDITRSLFGPLSKKQRFLSAAQRAARRMQAKAAKATITDPTELRNLVRLRSASPAEVARNLAAGDLAALVGAAGGDGIPEALAGEERPVLGSTIVAGRQSPAEAVGGPRPQQVDEETLPSGVKALHRHEGFRGQEYKDSVGVRTIGFGRNLESNPVTDRELREMGLTREEFNQNGVSREQAQVLFANDYARAVKTAVRLPGWEDLNSARKDVLINMAYNLGPTKLRGFKNMLKAVKAGDYDLAATEMLDSKWATQVGNRADELAEIMRTGVAS